MEKVQTPARKYEFNRDEAAMLFALVSNQCATIKNWIASAVEHNDTNRAMALVQDLRKHEKLFAKLNVEAHDYIDGLKPKT